MTDEGAGPPDRLEGQRLDPGFGGAVQPPERALHRAGRAVPLDRPELGRTRPASRSPPSCSAVAVRRTSRWSPSCSTGRTGVKGATVSSEMTAAAVGGVGQLRRDPFAMLPFLRLQHGRLLGPLAEDRHVHGSGEPAPHLRGQLVPQGRADGKFIWPGYGENSRVLEWIVRRIEGEAGAVDAATGRLPSPGRSTSTTAWICPSRRGRPVRDRPDHVARRVRPHRGVLREVR